MDGTSSGFSLETFQTMTSNFSPRCFSIFYSNPEMTIFLGLQQEVKNINAQRKKHFKLSLISKGKVKVCCLYCMDTFIFAHLKCHFSSRELRVTRPPTCDLLFT